MSRPVVTSGIRFLMGLPAILAATFWGGPTQVFAVEKASEQVSSFYGSFSHAIPIEVPGFRGLEPQIALSYSSEGRNGFVGTGWGVSGFSTIERVNAGLGSPKFDAADVHTFDGQELYPCQVGSVSPSCTTGGTHSTKMESYLRIKFESGPSTWTVWSKDGTKTILSPIINVPANAWVVGGTLRWGVSSRVDTDSNTVTYAWSCQDGDCYPSTATYNGYQVTFFKEARPDWLSWAGATVLGETRYRLRSVIVWAPGVSHIRGYKLTYEPSALTGRSLLKSVQQYGKDLVHSAGLLTGGTTLPAQTFTYQNDAIGFFDWAAPPTPPAYTTAVTWANHVHSATTGSGNSLLKTGGSASAWDAGADSTYAIASGNGYVEWVSSQPVTDGKAAGLSFGNTDATLNDIDFAFVEFENNSLTAFRNGVVQGTWPRATGDTLRIEVSGGSVYFKQNGIIRHQVVATPTYPLRVDASLRGTGASINSAIISGALINVNAWCQALLYSGDFNGDGRTDQLCYSSFAGGTSRVSLSSATGLQAPTTWLTGGLTNPVFADFNNDGKTDLARHDAWSGEFFVSLSTGSAFGSWALWGNATGTAPNGTAAHCRINPARVGSGDFNGDGVTDVYCSLAGSNLQFVGLSSGSAFTFSVFSQYSCDTAGDEQVGAIDFDGDGKDDWYCIGSDNDNMYVFPSTGSSFLWPAHGSLGFCSGSQYVLGDLNGDGRTDATCLSNGSVALSIGRSFQIIGSYGGWCGGGEAFAADVDGDGASEIVCNNAGAGATDIQVRKWNGAGQTPALAAAETWKANWCGGLLTVGDWNGDGKTDLYCKSMAAPAIAGTGSRTVDLMANATNGLGGSVAVQYVPSSAFVNTNNPPVKQVVASLNANDGRGGLSLTSFTYAGGVMDRGARQFLGFRYVRDQLPCLSGESACPYVENWFRQDLASAGKPESRVRRSGANILAKSEFTYSVNATIPRTSLLTGEVTRSYDGIGCPSSPCSQEKSTQVTHQYDAYGNRINSAYAGDLAATGDETLTTWHYRPATAGYLVGFLAKKVHFDNAGAAVAGTRYSYDRQGQAANWEQPPSKGHVTHTESWLKEESRWTVATKNYDSWGNRILETDPTNRSQQTTYDAARHIFPETFSNTAVPAESGTMLWDPVCGVPQQQTDSNGRVTTFTSDTLCRLVRTDHPTAGSPPVAGFELIHYRDFGDPTWQRVVVETPPANGAGLNVFSARHFDGLGRGFRLVERGPSASTPIVSEKVFNARGLMDAQTDKYYANEVPQLTTYRYDGLNRRTTTLHPDGAQRSIAYGLWSETRTDEEGRSSTRHFDAYGRVVGEERMLNGNPVTTSFVHDSLGRMVSMTGPLSIGWSWTYDSLGRVLAKSDPDAGTWFFQFDDADRPTRHVDAKAQRTQYSYDLRGWLQSALTYTAGEVLSSTVTYSYSQPRVGYYNVGQLTSVTGPGTTSLEYDYDARARPVKVRRTLDGSVYGMTRAFDSGSRIISLQFPDAESFTVGYDEAGRMKSVSTVLTNILWDAEGRVTQLAHADGSATQRGFSPERGFLTQIQTTGVGFPVGLQNLAYEHDDTGLITSVTSPVGGESWGYGYDDLGRLTDAQTTPPSADDQTWQYDDGGRMLFNSRIGSYTYGSTGYRPSTAGANTFSYDVNGNVLTGAGRTLTWSPENLLASVNSTSFVYDDEGERLKRTTGSSVSRYPVGDAYEVTDGVVTKYFRVPGVGVVAKKITRGTQAGVYAIHTDHLGSVRSITKTGTGNQALRRSYRTYGEQLAASGTNVESLGWIQERTDQSTGLTYLHARYYDAALGVMVSPDPLDPSQRALNSYGYSAADPVNFVDHTGLDEEPVQIPGTGTNCPGDPGCPPGGGDDVDGGGIPWDGYGGFPKHEDRRNGRRDPRRPPKTPRGPIEPDPPKPGPTNPAPPQCLMMECDDPGGDPNNNNNSQTPDDGMEEVIEIEFEFNEADAVLGSGTGAGVGLLAGNAAGASAAALGPGAGIAVNVLAWGVVVARFNAAMDGRYKGVIVRRPRVVVPPYNRK